ncbi:DUF1501 domain-containing protein [Caulobacter vibrioides]|uniref:DUF1501 domain-containing protein n=1 Tax=Caulobacter vibrioides TaxID=155892 RepID=A0A290MRI1_CAUVI|nr:DUF1501 domain-containing protein [Caulobacter vibrioides]ATC31505.1 DUF1501 domain-containing protein [Caulobacter vibrioides]
MTAAMNRRSLLGLGASLGFTVNLFGTQGFAATEGDLARKKLVVVICRGGMDGLSVSPPVGDQNYAALRGSIAMRRDQVLMLDDTFGLHPELKSVFALAQNGQARIAPAIASPDRARSHFEAQDVLETGSAKVYGAETGWLNRTLEALTPVRKVEGLSVGTTAPLILRGKVQAASWSPGKGVDETARLPMMLQDLYRSDPLLGPAFARGLETEAMAETAMATQASGSAMGGAGQNRGGSETARKLGSTLGGFLTQAGGPQIAAVSLDGFDTHANQPGPIATRLSAMDAMLDGLHTGLGAEWKNTVVVVVTEFGRTARINGTGGTDHGTASTGLILGGALKRGGIVGDWPGLADKALFENRDTAPTLDMRGLFKGVLADHMGVDRALLENKVFPDSANAKAVMGLV